MSMSSRLKNVSSIVSPVLHQKLGIRNVCKDNLKNLTVIFSMIQQVNQSLSRDNPWMHACRKVFVGVGGTILFTWNAKFVRDTRQTSDRLESRQGAECIASQKESGGGKNELHGQHALLERVWRLSSRKVGMHLGCQTFHSKSIAYERISTNATEKLHLRVQGSSWPWIPSDVCLQPIWTLIEALWIVIPALEDSLLWKLKYVLSAAKTVNAREKSTLTSSATTSATIEKALCKHDRCHNA